MLNKCKNTGMLYAYIKEATVYECRGIIRISLKGKPTFIAGGYLAKDGKFKASWPQGGFNWRKNQLQADWSERIEKFISENEIELLKTAQEIQAAL